MNALYFCADLPENKTTGGAQAHRYFISEFYKVFNENLTIIGISNDRTFKYFQQNFRPVYLDKKNFISLFINQIKKFSYPYKIISKYSIQSHIIIDEELKSQKYDLVIIDHFDSLSLISILKLKKIKKPIIYISHNIESKLLSDICNLIPSYNIKYWLAKIDLYKIKIIEKKLLRLSNIVIFLSEDDLSDVDIHGVQKFYSHIPITLKEIKKNINNEKNTKKILFSINYYFRPNLHALNWLTTEFANELIKLKSEVKIIVTGLPPEVLSKTSSTLNIEYKSFMPNAEFLKLYDQVDLFICPIMYGSGIKMKIIEALQNNIPVLAFTESWRGLKSLSKGAILPKEPSEAAVFVDQILNNPIRLNEIKLQQIDDFKKLIMLQKQIVDIVSGK